MNTNNKYMTSYKAGHRFLPTLVFESNISSVDAGKESMPNVPNLKWWNYDTTTKVNYNYKFDTSDPVQKPTRVNFDKTHYIMPQWEKYWSKPPKLMQIPLTEYNDRYIQPKLMSNNFLTPSTCVCPKMITHKKMAIIQTPNISDNGVTRKMDPYITTQKLAFTDINPVTAKQINPTQPKQKQFILKYEPFYNEPIFNRQNSIRLLPNTLKYVPHNALKTEMTTSYKIPINTLSNFDSTVEMPISISQKPTMSQIKSIPGMYTSEYSKIGRQY